MGVRGYIQQKGKSSPFFILIPAKAGIFFQTGQWNYYTFVIRDMLIQNVEIVL